MTRNKSKRQKQSYYEKQIEKAKECRVLSTMIWWTGFLLLPDGHHQKHSSLLLKLRCSHLLAFRFLLVYADKTKRIWMICGKVMLYHLYVQLCLMTGSKWCSDILDLTPKTPAQNARKQIMLHQYETYGLYCRGGVLEDIFWSPWLWPRSLKFLKIGLSSARRQHYFLNC